METHSQDNRRADPRFDVNIKVDYDTKDMFVSNYVTNISKGGLFIQTGDPLPIQSEISLTLVLPGVHATLQTKGKVCWTYDIKKGTSTIITGMGIKFTQLTPSDKDLLESYIRNLSDPSGKNPSATT